MTSKQWYSDVEMMNDGSYRWLWSIRNDTRLYRAGICMSATDAQACADRQLARMASNQLVEPHAAARARPGEPMLDLDAVERGPGDDDAA